MCHANGTAGLPEADGYESKGYARPLEVGDEHAEWTIKPGTLNEHQILPKVAQGPLVGQLVLAALTLQPLDFLSGPVSSGGSQQPVTFRTFTNGGVSNSLWPPDMSGAKAATWS